MYFILFYVGVGGGYSGKDKNLVSITSWLEVEIHHNIFLN